AAQVPDNRERDAEEPEHAPERDVALRQFSEEFHGVTLAEAAARGRWNAILKGVALRSPPTLGKRPCANGRGDRQIAQLAQILLICALDGYPHGQSAALNSMCKSMIRAIFLAAALAAMCIGGSGEASARGRAYLFRGLIGAIDWGMDQLADRVSHGGVTAHID